MTEVVPKFMSSNMYFPVHGRDLLLHFRGSTGFFWIQQAFKVLEAEHANFVFVFVLFSYFVFIQTGNWKKVHFYRFSEDI